MARTMWVISKKEYTMFSQQEAPLKQARKLYPELKGGRIRNVLQMRPELVEYGRLYRDGQAVPYDSKKAIEKLFDPKRS